jgi:hypothetical protein
VNNDEPFSAPPRFRFQFSIASLLALTTLTAVLLSVGAVNLPLAIVAGVVTIPSFFVTSLVGTRSRALIDKRIRAQRRTAVSVVSQENAEQDAAGAW